MRAGAIVRADGRFGTVLRRKATIQPRGHLLVRWQDGTTTMPRRNAVRYIASVGPLETIVAIWKELGGE